MSQPKKTFTIYFLTNDEKQTRKIILPVSYFKVAVFMVAFVIISLFAGFIDYFGLLAQSVENKKLKIHTFCILCSYMFNVFIIILTYGVNAVIRAKVVRII